MTRFSHADKIKQPNVSGQFYDANPLRLALQIDSFFKAAQVTPTQKDVEILICPHAGYVYSGPVAAYSYKAVSQKNYQTVIILAVSHYYGFDGISIWPQGGFQTPLGVVPVDTDLTQKLISPTEAIDFFPKVFEQEHSLEVQLPFLQKTFKNFKIVPVIMGQPSYALVEKFAQKLDAVIGDRKDILVVVSSDMSHYHQGAEARTMDQGTLELVKAIDAKDFWDECSVRKKEMCGFVPVTTALLLAKRRGLTAEVLRYANSGDVTGDESRVVGYSAVMFYKEPPAVDKKTAGAAEENQIPPLSKSQKKQLMDIAKKTVEDYVRTGKVYEPVVTDPRLKEIEGAFVTLHKNGALRGCIGNIIGRDPLYLTVRNMAVAAASSDPRFQPVSEKELAKLDFEISVLSKPRRAKSIDEIKLGVHGVIASRGDRGGVFLPQVATETGWTKEQFLSELCSQKAGLPADAWKDPQTKLDIFTADVFSEKDVR